MTSVVTVANPEGVHVVSLSIPTPPVFKYPMKVKYFGLSEIKLFHFHGIFKNEIKSATQTPRGGGGVL